MERPTEIAIVGMACMFPGAPDLDAYWTNLRTGFDAISDVPAARLDPVFFDATSRASNRFYCRRGGFIDAYASFDAAGFGVMPVAARGAEPDQLLSLQIAARALDDAGYRDRPFARDRAAVILGRGGYAGPGHSRLDQHVRGAEQLVVALRSLLPDLDDATLSRIQLELQANLGAAGADAAIGLVPNLVASRIAHRLDLHGPAFTVDAACASALIAVEQGCRELFSERCDLVIAGGVHVCHQELFWSVFCQLRALSFTGTIRPFDHRADGLLIGEGIGMVVLKRLADAERDNDRVYAVVRGAGSASDGRGATLMSPSVEGQMLAVERAWRESRLDPATVGLIEAHGTATPAGDAAELTTLARAFGALREGESRAVVGSVKSMIGHAMPAAGAAGLIKASLALHHGVLLPTLHCEEPSRLLASTRFRVVDRAEPWAAGPTPRRAGVNAFGFGGVNAHVVLEEHAPSRGRAAVVPASPPSGERVAFFSGRNVEALLAAVDRGDEGLSAGPARVAVFDPTPERMLRARKIVERGKAWRGRDGVVFSPMGLLAAGGTIAFVFPGVDATFEPRVDDVARHFGLPVPHFTRAQELGEVGMGIIGVNRLLDRVLREVGVRPSHVAGHSIGEWSGMIATGVVSENVLAAFVPAMVRPPGVVFAAVGGDVARARAAIHGLDGVTISHDNCPHQVLLCGHEGSIDEALVRLKRAGVVSQKLSFRSGFHSPLFADYVEPLLDPLREALAREPFSPPRTPLWSATTCNPYPCDSEEILHLSIRHLLEPVRFRELVERLYAEGVRVFVQVGTGSVANFVEDTLRARPHLAIQANVKERSGMDQLRRALAALLVEGADDVAFDRVASRASTAMKLALGVPMVRTFAPIPTSVGRTGATPTAGHPLAADFVETMGALEAAQREVLSMMSAPSVARLEPREWTSMLRLSLEQMPELVDHSFYQQRAGWPVVSDTFPLVPLTAIVDLAMEQAIAGFPGKVAIAVEAMRAYRWLAVSTPVEVTVTCRFDGAERVRVKFGDYAEGTVVLADAYPPAPPGDRNPLTDERPSISATELYEARWMFHGPAYRGVVDLGPIGSDGLRGVVETGAARGALLDGAGQMFGYWGMQGVETNRVLLPIGAARISFFGPHPRPGERLACTVRIREEGERSVVGDITLALGDRTWAVIDGWEDRRFESDARFWAMFTAPEKKFMAERAGGFVVFKDTYRTAPARDQVSRMFLGEAERIDYVQQGPKRQRAWLSGRVAAKDAVRDFLLRQGEGTFFPAEIALEDAEDGRIRVRTPSPRDVRVAVAHRDDTAVAMALEGLDGGIAIERIEARDGVFAASAFTATDLRLVEGEPRDLAWARLWVAKQAAAMARGRPVGSASALAVRDRAGERLLVEDLWVNTSRVGDFVVGWT